MDCNRYSTSNIKRDYNTPRCNRARLNTGTFCNYDCEFCYYQGELHIKTGFEKIKQRADILYQYGISEVDLSGGESSIHKNWFDILKYCNDKFTNISTLTNGWAFADENFLKKSKEHGLKEILFSLHGFNEQVHDEIVRRRGAWKKIIQAIENAHKNDIVVRINCTVYQKNYEGLLQYHEIIKQVTPLEVNFLTLNYWTNNRYANPIDYNTVCEYIKQCIDKIEPHVKYINVRYTPYCYMKGYEKYVCGHYHHIYDIYDWNKEIHEYDIDVTKKYSEKEKINMAYAEAERARIFEYKKPEECFNCKYFYICDGIEKQVTCDVNPVSGTKITDINHYRGNFYGE